MSEGYNAGRIIIEARLDTTDVASQLNEIQKNILASASTTESVFKNIGRTISHTMRDAFHSTGESSNSVRRNIGELNNEISQLDSRMSAYQKQIVNSETRLKALNVSIISISSSRRELNSETERSIISLKNESRAVEEQIKNFKKLYSELGALKKKRLQDRYENYIRQQNPDITSQNFANNREAATGAIIEAAASAMKHWKEAFGSFSNYGVNELKFLLTGQAGYSGGMEIFKKLGQNGAQNIIAKAKAYANAMDTALPNQRGFLSNQAADSADNRRGDKLQKFYDSYSVENYLSKKRSGMSKLDIEEDKIKQKLQKVLNDYNLTYELLEQREHESMLHRGEITKEEFLKLEGIYQLSREKLAILRTENDLVYQSFVGLAVNGLQELANGFGQTFANAIREGQNALIAFGNFFKSLFNQLINQAIALIAKLLVIKTLTAIFGGGGLIGKAFGLASGGGISESSRVYRAAGGWYVNAGSHSTADDVPVMLSRGEGVLNAKITRMLGGEPAIRALNRIGGASSFMQGGVVPSAENQTTNIYVEGSIIDTAGLIRILNEKAKNSGAKSLYNTGGII